MNSMTKTILAALAIVVAVLFYLSYFVVDQTHKALVLRFGDINRVVEKPGLYFKVPFADTVTLVDNRIMIWENNGRPVQDVASQVYIVDAFTLARIKDARLFRRDAGRRHDAGRDARRRPPRRSAAPDLWPPLLRCGAVVRPRHHDGARSATSCARRPRGSASRSSTCACAAPIFRKTCSTRPTAA